VLDGIGPTRRVAVDFLFAALRLVSEACVAEALFERWSHHRFGFTVVVGGDLEDVLGAGLDAVPASITLIRVDREVVLASPVCVPVVGPNLSYLFSLAGFSGRSRLEMDAPSALVARCTIPWTPMCTAPQIPMSSRGTPPRVLLAAPGSAS
jgi:hypothetical protein